MSMYNTFLDSLVFDSPNETVQTDKDIADELDLWSNAQFTFDVAPGVGIEEKPEPQGLDTATYTSLVNYLDYKAQPRILPRLAASTTTQQAVLSKPSPAINPLPTSTFSKKRVLEKEAISPEEDKRRRNTAASARFRIKKKMREQAMEQSVQEMTNKSEKLQERVNQLEAEIKFLRDLLLSK